MLLPSWLLAEAAQASPELVGDVRRALPSAAAATAPKIPSWQSIVLNPALLESRGSSVQVREAHAGTNGKLIIHIQDAHSNPGAQKHLAEALDDWMARYPMRLVLSEGGEGNTTLDAVRRTADAATWKRAAEQMLRDAIITGEEYLNLTSERPMTIWGVENEKLYERNLGVYAELMDDRGNRKKFLSRTRAAIDALKSREYPGLLLQYERRKAADAESGTSSVKALLDLARTAGVAWSGRYPNLESFSRVMERENGINFAQLNRETQELASRLSAAERDELQSALKQRASQDSESRAADAQVLVKKSQSHGGAAAYPQIHRYAEFVSQIQMIDWGAVMHDAENLEEDVYAAALRSDEEKRLHALDAWTGLLEKAFSIRLSTREYQRLNRLRTAFPADGWQAWLNRKLADAKLFDRMIAADRRLDEGFERVMRFYELVERRDQEFIQNTLAALADQKADAAFLITGGYHTDHLTELLKENGFSYVVAAPWVDSETDQALYEKVLLRKTETNAGAAKTTDVTQDSAGSFLRTHLATPAILAARLADLSASRPVYRDVLPGVQKILAARLAETQSAVRSNYDLLVRQFAAAFADASEINEDGNDGPARLLYFDIDPATGLIRHLMDEFPDDGDYPHFTLEAVEAFRIEQGATDLVHYAILPHYRANGQSVKTRWFPIGGIPAAQAERIENVLEQSFAAFNDRPYVATVPSASSAGARLAMKPEEVTDARTVEFYRLNRELLTIFHEYKMAKDKPESARLRARFMAAARRNASFLDPYIAEVREADASLQAELDGLSVLSASDKQKLAKKLGADIQALTPLFWAAFESGNQQALTDLNTRVVILLKRRLKLQLLRLREELSQDTIRQGPALMILQSVIDIYRRLSYEHVWRRRRAEGDQRISRFRMADPNGTLVYNLYYQDRPLLRIERDGQGGITLRQILWKQVDVENGPQALVPVMTDMNYESLPDALRSRIHALTSQEEDYARFVYQDLTLQDLAEALDAAAAEGQILSENKKDDLIAAIDLLYFGIEGKKGLGRRVKRIQDPDRRSSDLPRPKDELSHARALISEPADAQSYKQAADHLQSIHRYIEGRLKSLENVTIPATRRKLNYVHLLVRDHTVRQELVALSGVLSAQPIDGALLENAIQKLDEVRDTYFSAVPQRDETGYLAIKRALQGLLMALRTLSGDLKKAAGTPAQSAPPRGLAGLQTKLRSVIELIDTTLQNRDWMTGSGARLALKTSVIKDVIALGGIGASALIAFWNPWIGLPLGALWIAGIFYYSKRHPVRQTEAFEHRGLSAAEQEKYSDYFLTMAGANKSVRHITRQDREIIGGKILDSVRAHFRSAEWSQHDANESYITRGENLAHVLKARRGYFSSRAFNDLIQEIIGDTIDHRVQTHFEEGGYSTDGHNIPQAMRGAIEDEVYNIINDMRHGHVLPDVVRPSIFDRVTYFTEHQSKEMLQEGTVTFLHHLVIEAVVPVMGMLVSMRWLEEEGLSTQIMFSGLWILGYVLLLPLRQATGVFEPRLTRWLRKWIRPKVPGNIYEKMIYLYITGIDVKRYRREAHQDRERLSALLRNQIKNSGVDQRMNEIERILEAKKDGSRRISEQESDGLVREHAELQARRSWIQTALEYAFLAIIFPAFHDKYWYTRDHKSRFKITQIIENAEYLDAQGASTEAILQMAIKEYVDNLTEYEKELFLIQHPNAFSEKHKGAESVNVVRYLERMKRIAEVVGHSAHQKRHVKKSRRLIDHALVPFFMSQLTPADHESSRNLFFESMVEMMVQGTLNIEEGLQVVFDERELVDVVDAYVYSALYRQNELFKKIQSGKQLTTPLYVERVDRMTRLWKAFLENLIRSDKAGEITPSLPLGRLEKWHRDVSAAREVNSLGNSEDHQYEFPTRFHAGARLAQGVESTDEMRRIYGRLSSMLRQKVLDIQNGDRTSPVLDGSRIEAMRRNFRVFQSGPRKNLPVSNRYGAVPGPAVVYPVYITYEDNPRLVRALDAAVGEIVKEVFGAPEDKASYFRSRPKDFHTTLYTAQDLRPSHPDLKTEPPLTPDEISRIQTEIARVLADIPAYRLTFMGLRYSVEDGALTAVFEDEGQTAAIKQRLMDADMPRRASSMRNAKAVIHISLLRTLRQITPDELVRIFEKIETFNRRYTGENRIIHTVEALHGAEERQWMHTRVSRPVEFALLGARLAAGDPVDREWVDRLLDAINVLAFGDEEEGFGEEWKEGSAGEVTEDEMIQRIQPLIDLAEGMTPYDKALWVDEFLPQLVQYLSEMDPDTSYGKIAGGLVGKFNHLWAAPRTYTVKLHDWDGEKFSIYRLSRESRQVQFNGKPTYLVFTDGSQIDPEDGDNYLFGNGKNAETVLDVADRTLLVNEKVTEKKIAVKHQELLARPSLIVRDWTDLPFEKFRRIYYVDLFADTFAKIQYSDRYNDFARDRYFDPEQGWTDGPLDQEFVLAAIQHQLKPDSMLSRLAVEIARAYPPSPEQPETASDMLRMYYNALAYLYGRAVGTTSGSTYRGMLEWFYSPMKGADVVRAPQDASIPMMSNCLANILASRSMGVIRDADWTPQHVLKLFQDPNYDQNFAGQLRRILQDSANNHARLKSAAEWVLRTQFALDPSELPVDPERGAMKDLLDHLESSDYRAAVLREGSMPAEIVKTPPVSDSVVELLSRLKDAGSWKAESGKELDLLRAVLKSFGRVPVMYLPTRDNSQYHGQLILDGLSSVSGWLNDTQIGIIKQHFLTRSKQAARLASVRHEALRLEGGSIDAVQVERRVAELFSPVASALEPDQKLYATVEVGTRFERDALADLGFAVKSGTDEEVAADIADMIEKSGIESVSLTGFDLSVKLKGMSEADLPDITLHRKFNQQFSANIRSAVEPRALADRVKMSAVVSSLITGLRTGDVLVSAETLDAWFSVPRVMEFPSDPAQREALSVALGVLDVNLAPSQIAGAEDWRSFLAESAPKPAPNSITETATAAASERKELIVKIAQAMDEWLGSWPAREFGKREDLANGLAHYLRVLTRPIQESDLGTAVKILQKISLERLAQDPALYKRIRTQQMDSLAVFKQVFMVRRREFQERVRSWQDNGGVSDEKLLSLTHDLYLYLVKMRRLLMVCELMTADSMVRPSDREAYDYLLADLMFTEDAYLKISRELVSSRIMAQDTIDRERLTVSYLEDPDTDTAQADAASLQPMVVELRGLLEQDIADLNDGFTAKTLGRRYGEVLKLAGDLERELTGRPELTDEAKYLIGAIFQSMIVIRRNHMNYSWSPSEGFRGTMGEKSGVQADDPYVLLFERLLPAAGIHGADVRALFEADGARLAMDRSSDESVITEVVANFVERYSKLPKATTDPVLLTRIRKKLIRMMMSQPYTSWEPDGAEESLLPIEETLVRFPEMREPRQLLRLIGWSMTSRDEMEADAFILPDVEKLLMRPNFSIQDLDTVVAPAMGIARRSRVFGLSGIVKAYEAGLSSEQVKDLMAPFLATRSTQVGHLMDFAGRLVSWHHLSPEEVQDLLLPVLQKNIMFAGVDSHLLTEVFTNKKIGKKNFVRFMKPFAALGLSAWDADNAIDAVLLQSLRSKTWTAREIVRHLYPLIGAGKEDAWFFISKVTAGVKSGKIRKTDVVPHFLPLIWAFGSTPEKVFLYAYDQLRLKGFPKPKPLENDAITDAINENKRGPFYKQSLYRDFAARHANEEVSVETVRLELALPIIEAAIRHIDWARQHKKPVVNLYGEQGERYYQWLLETKKLLGSDMLEQINRMFDTNSSESVRVAAIRTLGGTQFDAARRALETELLSSGDSVNDLIRMEVLEALARIGSAESLPTVKVVVSSPDFSAPLRVKAREVHDRISAQSTSAARLANFDWNDMLLALYVEYGTETFTSKDLAEKDVRGASTLLSYQRTGWIEQVDPTSRTFRLTESGRSLAEARMQHYGSDVTKYPYLFQIQRPNIPRKPDQGEILKRLQSIRARQARFQEIQPTSAELAGIIGIEESELAAFIEKLNAPPAPEPGDRSDRLVLAIAADLNPDRFTMSELTRGGVKDAGDALSGAGWRAPGGALIEELDGGVKVLDPVTNRMTRAYRLTEKGKAYVRQRQSQFQSIIDQPFLFESVKFDPKREVKKLGTAAWDSIRRRFRRLPEEKRGEAQKVLAKRLGMSANELWLKLAEPMSASMPNEKLLKAKLKEVLNGLRGLKRTAVHDARAFDKPIEAIVHMADKRQSSKLVGFYAEGLRQVRADFVTLNEHYHHLNTTVFFGDQWSKTLKLIEEAEAIVQAAQDQVSDKGGSSPASAARLAATQEWAEANGLQILAGGHEGEVASGDGDLLDVVDENGAVREELSPMTQADVHIKGEWHKTVHIHVFAPDGRLLLQRRSLRKSSSPGKLQVAVSGHVNAGEGDLQAAIREAEEELGLVLRPEDLIDVTGGKRLVRDYQLATGRNRELTTAYAVRLTQDQLDRIVSNYNLLEVQDVWLVPMDRLQQLVHEAPEAFSNSLRQLVEPEQGGILTRLFESGNKTEKLPQKDLLTVSDETFLETKLRFEKLAPGQHVEDVVSSLREEADPALWKFVTLGQLEYSVRLSKMTLDELRGEWEVLDVGRPGMDGLPGDIAANPIQNFSHHLRNDRFYLIYPDGLSSQVLERAAMRHALKREIYYRWDRVPKNRSHLLFRPDVTRRPASDTGARLAANVEPQEILSDTDQDMEARNRKIVDQFNSLRGVLKGVDMGSGLEGNFVDDVESGAWLPRARFVGYELPPVVPASLDKVGDRVVLRSAADTGLDDASVDVVTINMPSPPTIPDLLPGFLQEADRILKPGGKVYLTVQQPRADDLVYPSIQDLALSHRPGKLNFVPQVREILKTTRLNVEVDGASVETLGFDYPETTYMNLLKRSGWDVVMFTAEKPAVTPASLQTAAVDGARLAENAFDSLKPVTLKGLEEADREAAVRQLAEAARQGVSGTVAYRVTQAEYVMTEIQVAKSVTVGDGSWSATLPRAAQEVRPAPGTDSGAGDSVVEIAQQIRQEEADFVEAAVRKTAATQQPVVIQLAIRIGGWMDQTRDPQNSKKAYLRYQLAKLRELKKRDPNLYFEWNEKLTDADTIALLNTVAPDLVAPKAPVNTPVISVVDVLGGEKPSGDTRSFYEQGMAKEGVLPRLLESVVLASDLARLADPEHISQEQLDRWSSLAQTPVSREAAIRILTGQATPDEMLKYAIRARGLSLNINQLLTLFQVGARMSAIAA